MSEITRSPGVSTGVAGWLCGNGFRGVTPDLDSTVERAAEALAEAYGMAMTIRFNSDRRSGGAWLKTDDPDGVWLNAEVGICASLVTEEQNARMAAKYPEMADDMRDPGIYICAHVGKRVGEYAHVAVDSIEDALLYVQAHADLARLEQS